MAEISERDKLHSRFIRSYNKAKTTADTWAPLLEKCFQYAVPFRNNFYRPHPQQGEQKGTRIYDTTAIEAVKTFVSRLHNSMTPPQIQWGYLEVSEDYDKEGEDVKMKAQQALDTYMRKLFEYIHTSNFDVVINECYFDLAIGTACLVINPYKKNEPLLFTSIPLDKLAIKESVNGRIENWWRTWEDIKINEIQLKWPHAKLTDSMLQNASIDPDACAKKLYEGVMYLPDSSFPYVYALSDGDSFLFAESLESNPGIVWRFQKTNAETWGRGPIMDALPSIVSLNEMARIELASANLNTFRPYMAFSDNVFNPHTFKLEPFAIIPIAPISAGGQPPLIPLPDSSNPQFAQLTIMDLRNQIKTLLFNDAQESPTIQPQSATEAMINQQDLAQKIGPLFSRLQQEFLWPVIDRCSYLLDAIGILPRPKVDGHLIKFAYRSPLAASRGQQEMAKFTQFAQLAQGLYGEQIANLFINPTKALYKIADYIQLDPEFLNPIEQVEQATTQMAKDAQEQQEILAEQGQQQPQQGG